MHIFLGLYLFLVSLIQATDSIQLTYGSQDLASKPPFQGGYINFGFWKNINAEKEITKKQRIQASQKLYWEIFDHLNITTSSRVLEVGCGHGVGLLSLMNSVSLSLAVGIDITPEQVNRAQKKLYHPDQKQKNALFMRASAENMPFADNTFSRIFSVEAAQCFPSIKRFAKEAKRVLAPNGKIVITAHFSTSAEGYEATKELLPTVKSNIDRTIPIAEVIKAFETEGFIIEKTIDIGDNVFPGFDKWISQVEDEPWAHNIYTAFEKGHLSYYILVMRKSGYKNARIIQKTSENNRTP